MLPLLSRMLLREAVEGAEAHWKDSYSCTDKNVRLIIETISPFKEPQWTPGCWHRSIAACGGSVRPSSKRGRNPGSAGTHRAVGQPGQEVDGAPGLCLPAPAACCIADIARMALPNAPNQNA